MKNFFVKKNKAAELTTDDLKYILSALNRLRTNIMRDYMSLPFSVRSDPHRSIVRDYQFQFTMCSYLLHKICPETFDLMGVSSRSSINDENMDVVKILYLTKLVGDEE